MRLCVQNLAFIILQFEFKSESRALLKLRSEWHFTIEHLYNLLWNDKTQADTILVELLCVFNEAKKLEEFFLIVFFNADSWILNGNWEESTLIFLLNLDNNADTPLRCEF